MNCVLDNIIFSLQRSGGISVVRQEHVKWLLCETDFNCEFIEYKNASQNILRRNLRIPNLIFSLMLIENSGEILPYKFLI